MDSCIQVQERLYTWVRAAAGSRQGGALLGSVGGGGCQGRVLGWVCLQVAGAVEVDDGGTAGARVGNRDPLGLQWQACWPNKPLARGGGYMKQRPRKKEAGMQVAQRLWYFVPASTESLSRSRRYEGTGECRPPIWLQRQVHISWSPMVNGGHGGKWHSPYSSKL